MDYLIQKHTANPEFYVSSRRLDAEERRPRRSPKELYRLTQREVEVVKNLLKGWSNKEIANELRLTKQTVKEHLQRIMSKTKTTSRTGILARVLCV